MKFFYLGHGLMSYECLRELIEKGYKPTFVAIHKDLDYENLREIFYDPMNSLCKEKSITLYPVDKISSINDKISECEVGICLGFMEILKKETLDLPKHGIVNVHGGKLPKYRGRAPITRSIINGENFFTLTLHKMDEGVDSGDICLETEIPITDKDDLNTLYAKCSAEAAPLVEKFFEAFKRGTLDCKKQDLSQNPKPFRKITDEERKINWTKSARGIFNLIRALVPPYPCAFFEHNGKKYLVTRAEMNENAGKPGEVIDVAENSLLTACENGSINIISLADENLNPVSIIDNFYKGDMLR